jgi:hypothetical protein
VGEDEEIQGNQILRFSIVIDETPVCFWVRDFPVTQLPFLEGIDPGFFRYLASVHQSQLEGDDQIRAAVALRVTYSHALESMFAFIGAAVQAPHCPVGWLLKYRNADLHGLVNKIANRKPFYSKLNLSGGGWEEVASTLMPLSGTGENGNELQLASAKLWDSLSRDFLDDSFGDEYNSLKHGFRITSGDWYFAIGREDVPGTPAPPERMRVMASSQIGSSFLRPLPLVKHQWAIEDQRVNWNPAVFAKRIPLIADSIDNVLSFLKYVNGVPAEQLKISPFNQTAVAEALHDPDYSSSSRFSFRLHIPPEVIPALSRDDILSEYVQTVDTHNDLEKT